MRILKLTPLVVVIGAVLLAGCGGSDGPPPPPASTILTKTLTASKQIHSGSFEFKLSGDVKAGPGNAKLAKFLAKPFKVEASGKFNRPNIAIEGKSEGGPLKDAIEVGLIKVNRSGFVKVSDRWFKLPPSSFQGVDDKLASGGFSAAADSEKRAKILTAIRAYGDRILDSKVSSGPEVDGQPTWELKAKINPDGLKEVAKEVGKLKDSDSGITNKKLRQLVEGIEMKLTVGQKDWMLRGFELKASYDQDALKDLSDGKASVEKVDLELSLKFTDVNEAVEITAPDNAGSWAEGKAQLSQLLMSIMVGAAGSGGMGQPSLPPV